MRVGIDASRAFGEQRTGTENYSYEMIRHILALPEAKKHEWILYVRDVIPSEVEGSLRSRVKLGSVGMKIHRIDYKFLWTQVGLAARTWLDRLDVLWVPAHTLPVLRNPAVKTVVTIHGIEYEWLPAFENKLQRWYLPLSTKYAVASADRLIAVSEFTKRQLMERLGAKDYKIEVVYEGVATSPPTPLLNSGEGNQRGEVLKKYGLGEKKYLIFIGTVQPRKNLERLIEAVARTSQVKLVIVGKLGWNYEKVLEAPSRFKIEDRVKLIGYVDDIERDVLLQSALAYVQPSITEGFGLPIVEAWKSGVPVVSSNGGALREILQIPNPKNVREASEVPNYAGILFNPLDVDDMTDKLKLMLNDSKLRQKLIDLGRKRVGEFTWDKAARKTYNILTKWN